MAPNVSSPRFPGSGGHTAHGGVMPYRLGKLADRGIIHGDWLDVGCAEGYFALGLADRGASSVVGIEPIAERVALAREQARPNVSFVLGTGEGLPFADASFDGVLLNEVLEHVADERATLAEIVRVLRPGGHLALFSPNRWFPFEGHGARWSETRMLLDQPVPLMPWLPDRWTAPLRTARNYWPGQLAALVTAAGLQLDWRGWALIQFEQYPWLPPGPTRWYRRHLNQIEVSPLARFFAVSTVIVGRKPAI